nr:MAG TPA: hypothetical protein [Caudoviricetes sp.]
MGRLVLIEVNKVLIFREPLNYHSYLIVVKSLNKQFL